MRITDTSDLWWKSAIIYCLDIETYFDSDGDGVGDLGGLATKIDYLAELGINCLWLMPCYPGPDGDDGYDILDFYGVDPRLGNHGELVEVIRTAHDRGLRVVADLIVNHTSDQHPLFKASRRSKDNPFRSRCWSPTTSSRTCSAASRWPMTANSSSACPGTASAGSGSGRRAGSGPDGVACG